MSFYNNTQALVNVMWAWILYENDNFFNFFNHILWQINGKYLSYLVCTLTRKGILYLTRTCKQLIVVTILRCVQQLQWSSTHPRSNLVIVFWMCSWFMIQYTRKLFYISCSEQTDKGDKSLTLSKTNSFILEISPKTHFVMITMMLCMLLFRIHWSSCSLALWFLTNILGSINKIFCYHSADWESGSRGC